MFYSEFAADYEKIFPFSEQVFSFLKDFTRQECSRILDIGCATGHYCGKFSDGNTKVTGIDVDSEMINKARETYADASFLELNLEDIHRLSESYNLVYSTGNVMAHIDRKSFSLFLDSLKQILSEKGLWIFQVINWDYILARREFDFPLIESEDKVFLRNYTEITGDSLLFNTELKDRKKGTSLFKDKVTLYPLPSEEILKMHRKKGFQLIGHYSDYSKSPFRKDQFSADIYVFHNRVSRSAAASAR